MEREIDVRIAIADMPPDEIVGESGISQNMLQFFGETHMRLLEIESPPIEERWAMESAFHAKYRLKDAARVVSIKGVGCAHRLFDISGYARCQKDIKQGFECSLGTSVPHFDHPFALVQDKKSRAEPRIDLVGGNPYLMSDDTDWCNEIAEQARAYGGKVLVSARQSWHFPGRTALIVVDMGGIL